MTASSSEGLNDPFIKCNQL